MLAVKDRYDRICALCSSPILRDKKQVFHYKPLRSELIKSWYGICDCCQRHYPEIQETFARISDLPDDIGTVNHTVMFNLINSIKNYRNGETYIPPFRGK